MESAKHDLNSQGITHADELYQNESIRIRLTTICNS